MECNDERAKQLLYSFDGLQDPTDEEYLRDHLIVCASCRRRLELFKSLDGLMRQSLHDLVKEHVNNEKLDQYLTNPEGLSSVERTAIKLHLEACTECRSASEVLAECNKEIAGGLWEEVQALSANEEQEFQKAHAENRDRLKAFFTAGQESDRDKRAPLKQKRPLLSRLIGPAQLIWVAVFLVIVSAAIYWFSMSTSNHTRSTGSEIRLISPLNEEDLGRPYIFRWEQYKDAIEYEIVIRDIERPDEAVIRVGKLAQPEYRLTESESQKLEPGRLYQWEVLATTASQGTVSSPIRIFKAPNR